MHYPFRIILLYITIIFYYYCLGSKTGSSGGGGIDIPVTTSKPSVPDVPPTGVKRTIVFMKKSTTAGQDIFLRGGKKMAVHKTPRALYKEYRVYVVVDNSCVIVSQSSTLVLTFPVAFDQLDISQRDQFKKL